MTTTFYKNERFQIVFDMNSMKVKIIDNEINKPLLSEEVDGKMTLGEFCQYVEKLKKQLYIN